MMTIAQALRQATDQLTAAHVPDPRNDALLLLGEVMGMPHLLLSLHGQKSLSTEQEQRFSSLLLCRASREPLQYLLGRQCFYGLDFHVDSRVLIPRQETEILCEIAIRHLKQYEAPCMLDVCTGSGAIAVTLKRECPRADVFAVDLSADALEVAKQNARDNGTDITFAQGDLFAPVKGRRFDLIASNPPYIPSEECLGLQAEVMREPVMALDGGEDGLAFYRRIVTEAALYLAPHAMLCMEVGDGQAGAVAELLAQQGCYPKIEIHRDLYGAQRVVSACASFPT